MGSVSKVEPITDAGTQVLIAGGALGLILGLTMLVFTTSSQHPKEAFTAIDLTVIAVLLLTIFCVYLYKLLQDLGDEEEEVQAVLELSEQEMADRRDLVYQNVKKSNLALVLWLLALGILGAFLGGERVAKFAELAIEELGLRGSHTRSSQRSLPG